MTKSDRFLPSLEDLHQAARDILKTQPGSIVTWRLLREVLRLPPDDPELVKARNAAYSSRWVEQLEQSQLPNGSWGRFHSQDTAQKAVFRTTEEAIDRALALGLEPNEGVLARVRQYIINVLHGQAHITDRDEKHAAWPLGIKFILVGRLAQLDPDNPLIEADWHYLAEVARQAFSTGGYQREDEAGAYLRLSGIHWPQGFLGSQHALRILSTQKLPVELEHHLMSWIWHKPDGIGYLGAPLSEIQPRRIGCWLRSMSIVSRFTSWRAMALNTMNHIWELRDQAGFWDFGRDIPKTIDFPLSENWRQTIRRKQDYSTCILVLLRRYYDAV